MRLVAILGGASNGLAELKSLPREPDAVFAVNDAAADYSGVLAAFVTLHHEKLPEWLKQRRAARFPEPAAIVAAELTPHVTQVLDYRFPGMTGSGSSGLFAVKAALHHGYERVVCCGVPMEAVRGHYFNSAPWDEVYTFREAWEIAIPHLRECVRSCSGWTSQLLGKPTTEWFGA